MAFADLQKDFRRFDLETWDEDEEYRLEGIQIAKLRGKGPPKKKRTADSKFRYLDTKEWSSYFHSNEEGKEEKVMSLPYYYAQLTKMIPCMKRYLTNIWSHSPCATSLVNELSRDLLLNSTKRPDFSFLNLVDVQTAAQARASSVTGRVLQISSPEPYRLASLSCYRSPANGKFVLTIIHCKLHMRYTLP